MNFNELWDTKCEKDYKSRHYWDSIGIFENECGIYKVWQCSQCCKAIYEKLSILDPI